MSNEIARFLLCPIWGLACALSVREAIVAQSTFATGLAGVFGAFLCLFLVDYARGE